MTPRTVQNWEAARTRVPYMAAKLLRLLDRAHLGHRDWDGWLLHHGRLYPPTGNHSYTPWELEQLDAIFRQARLFRSLYDARRSRPK